MGSKIGTKDAPSALINEETTGIFRSSMSGTWGRDIIFISQLLQTIILSFCIFWFSMKFVTNVIGSAQVLQSTTEGG